MARPRFVWTPAELERRRRFGLRLVRLVNAYGGWGKGTHTTGGVLRLAARLAPISEALKWKPTDLDPRPWWRWCRPCVGHAVALCGMEKDVLTRISEEGER